METLEDIRASQEYGILTCSRDQRCEVLEVEHGGNSRATRVSHCCGAPLVLHQNCDVSKICLGLTLTRGVCAGREIPTAWRVWCIEIYEN